MARAANKGHMTHACSSLQGRAMASCQPAKVFFCQVQTYDENKQTAVNKHQSDFSFALLGPSTLFFGLHSLTKQHPSASVRKERDVFVL